MSTDDFKEWRGLTPILLASIIVLGGATSFFLVTTLTDVKAEIHTTFASIGEVKASIAAYEDTADQRFVRIETELQDIPKYIKPLPSA